MLRIKKEYFRWIYLLDQDISIKSEALYETKHIFIVFIVYFLKITLTKQFCAQPLRLVWLIVCTKNRT